MRIALIICFLININATSQKKLIGLQAGVSSSSFSSSISSFPVFYTKSIGFSLGYTKNFSDKKFLKNKFGAFIVYNPILEKFESFTKTIESKVQLTQFKIYHQPFIYILSQKDIKPFVALGYYGGLRIGSNITYRINGDKWIKDGSLIRNAGFYGYIQKRPIDAGFRISTGLYAKKFPIEICLEKGLIKYFPENYLSSLSIIFTL